MLTHPCPVPSVVVTASTRSVCTSIVDIVNWTSAVAGGEFSQDIIGDSVFSDIYEKLSKKMSEDYQ